MGGLERPVEQDDVCESEAGTQADVEGDVDVDGGVADVRFSS